MNLTYRSTNIRATRIPTINAEAMAIRRSSGKKYVSIEGIGGALPRDREADAAVTLRASGETFC